MALKKLFGVALLLGVAAACGGTTGKAAHDANEDQPPGNSDQPPVSSDQPTDSDDQPPVNTDRPSSNPDSAGGGRLQELCDKFCEFFDRCDLGMDEMVGSFCEADSCGLPPGAEAQVPCLDQALDAMDCVLSLAVVCSDTAPPPSDAAVQRCQRLAEDLTECQGDYEPPSGEGPGNDPDPNPGNEGNCTEAGGCENCVTSCAECLCEATGDQTATAACAMSPACTNP